MKTHALAAHAAGPYLVVHGLDETGRPKAGTFKKDQATLANSAAAMLRLKVLIVKTTEQAAVAAKLPSGKLYSNGKSFVPFVRRDLYAKLVALASGKTKAGSTTRPNASKVYATARKKDATKASERADNGGQKTNVSGAPADVLPRSWDEVKPGHLVLAQESAEDGWWEAIVTQREGDALTLRWRDFSKYPAFKRHISTVGLVNPST